MSIENRIATAYKHFFDDDIENALIQLSIAVDAYAKKKYKIKKVGQRIKTLLNDNMEVISLVGTMGYLKAPSLTFPDGKLESILYESVRCSLLHEAEVSERIEFIKGNQLFVVSDKLGLNENFVLGLLISIIVDDEDKILNLREIPDITFRDKQIKIADIHGNRKALFDSMSRARSA